MALSWSKQKPAAAVFGDSAAGGPQEMRPVMSAFCGARLLAYRLALVAGSIDFPHLFWCFSHLAISQALSSTYLK